MILFYEMHRAGHVKLATWLCYRHLSSRKVLGWVVKREEKSASPDPPCTDCDNARRQPAVIDRVIDSDDDDTNVVPVPGAQGAGEVVRQMSLAAAQAARTEKSHALFSRLAEVSKTARTPKEQAEALGVPAKNIKFIRYHARKAGFNLDAETSRTLDSVAMEMAKAGKCRRCSLRGPHLCTTAENMADFGPAAKHHTSVMAMCAAAEVRL